MDREWISSSAIREIQASIMEEINRHFLNEKMTSETPYLLKATIQRFFSDGFHDPNRIQMGFKCNMGEIFIYPQNLYTALLMNWVIDLTFEEVEFMTVTETHGWHKVETIKTEIGAFTLTTYFDDPYPTLSFLPSEPASFISVTIDLPKE